MQEAPTWIDRSTMAYLKAKKLIWIDWGARAHLSPRGDRLVYDGFIDACEAIVCI